VGGVEPAGECAREQPAASIGAGGVRDGAGGGRRRLCGMRAATVPGCGRRPRCGSGRQRWCGMRAAASVRDAGGDGDAVTMRGVGDGGMGDGGSLPPELALCATPSSSSGLRMEKGRGGARLYSPGPLVPVSNTIRD
jgi:hypothetical protein